uniref:Putative secreted protein n=1 Tax=Ixodes ricinus TaxID=34613 RepID=A0A6B0UB81_IXORI
MSVWGSVSLVPYSMFFIITRCFETSSWAFSAFLSPRSSASTASRRALTSSPGLFCDFPNSGIAAAAPRTASPSRRPDHSCFEVDDR